MRAHARDGVDTTTTCKNINNSNDDVNKANCKKNATTIKKPNENIKKLINHSNANNNNNNSMSHYATIKKNDKAQQ